MKRMADGSSNCNDWVTRAAPREPVPLAGGFLACFPRGCMRRMNGQQRSRTSSIIPFKSKGTDMKNRKVLAVSLAVWTLASVIPTHATSADTATSRNVTGRASAAGSQIILNQIDTSTFPNVSIYSTVLKDGAPLRG